MKKVLFLSLFCLCGLLPVFSGNFIRVNYVSLPGYSGANDITGNGMGLSYSLFPDTNFGFFMTAEPYLLFNLKESDSNAKLNMLDTGKSAFGTLMLFGIGTDISTTRSGFVLGGGLLLGYDYFKNAPETAHTISGGLGIETNIYFPLGKGNLQLTIGATLGWNLIAAQYYQNDWTTYVEPAKIYLSVGGGLAWKSSRPSAKYDEEDQQNETTEPPNSESSFTIHDDDLIVPKERVGNFYLKMMREEILPNLGNPDAIFYGSRRYTVEDDPHEAYYIFRSVGISFQFRGRDLVGMTVLDSRYSTTEGLKVGMTKDEVTGIMGSLGTARGSEGYRRYNSMRLNLEFSGDNLREIEITEY